MISSMRCMPSWPYRRAGRRRANDEVPGLGGGAGLAPPKRKQRHVHHRAFRGQAPAGLETVRRQRHLYGDILGDLGQRCGPRGIVLWSVATVSALTGPGTMAQISAITSSIGRPAFMISDRLVVTPSSRPEAARSLISHIGGIDKELHINCPNGSGSGSAVATISSDSASDPQAEAVDDSRAARWKTHGRGRCAMLLPLPLADAYDYSVPEGRAFEPGPSSSSRSANARSSAWRGEGHGEVPPH